MCFSYCLIPNFKVLVLHRDIEFNMPKNDVFSLMSSHIGSRVFFQGRNHVPVNHKKILDH